MVKYKGIKPPTKRYKGNLQEIWIRQSNGTFTYKDRVLTENQIHTNLRNGYLKPI